MAIENKVFSVVEDTGFGQLAAHLQPKLNVPRCYFAGVALPAVYDVVAAHSAFDLYQRKGRGSTLAVRLGGRMMRLP